MWCGRQRELWDPQGSWREGWAGKEEGGRAEEDEGGERSAASPRKALASSRLRKGQRPELSTHPLS